jgi:hypothetical protein
MTATRKLCLLHLAANALLLWLAYEWLGVGESTGLRLVWSALDALAILALAGWLYGATFVFFGQKKGERRLNEAYRTALRHLAPLLVAAIALLVLYGGLVWVTSNLPSLRVANFLTLKLRRPVKPAPVQSVLLAAMWLVRWAVIPVAIVPMLAAIARRGWSGFGAITWRTGWRRWILVPALLAAGLILPFVILGWVPHMPGFGMEMVSFSLRLLCAYLLFIGAMVGLAGRTA